MNTPLKKTLTLLLAAALTLGCVTTAFAANIDFGDGTLGPSISGDASYNSSNNTVTVNDQDNTISGNGSNWSINFTDPDANVTVNGDVKVGGIEANGDLTITGGAGDKLTSNSSSAPGIQTGGDLNIIGGVTVEATGGGGVGSVGVEVGGDLNIDHGTLTATGGTGTSSQAKGLSVTGKIYEGGLLRIPESTSDTTVTLTASAVNNPGEEPNDDPVDDLGKNPVIKPGNDADKRKNTVKIIVTQNPQFAIVGQEVTIIVYLGDIIIIDSPQTVTITFLDGNNVVHTISGVSITQLTETSGMASITYTYTEAYPSLIIMVSFDEDEKNNSAVGGTTTNVFPAPTS